MFKILEKLSLSSEKTRKIYAERTRDLENLKVYIDEDTGVIFIDDYYVGDSAYEAGSYRGEDDCTVNVNSDYERDLDCLRRVKLHQESFTGKKILDFGCGAGDFLKAAKEKSTSVIGIELQENYIEHLREENIKCYKDLNEINNNSIDVIFSFHVLEHLPNPIDILRKMKSKLVQKGKIIIEVPHANDFLLSHLRNEYFKRHTLWSQHLILLTRFSLETFLKHSGFSEILIKGTQRYPLSNHINWLSKKKPGGFNSSFSKIDSEELRIAYECSLDSIDATDTLFAIATKS
tara:strand:+ start:4148 stop:5017 length:870 start_codon:yes stop_codon:yes gene_type:complete